MEWLHFSDFHIGGSRGPQAEVLSSLLDQVKRVCATGAGNIDAVFLAGDLAFSGKTEQYQRLTDDFIVPLLTIPGIAHAKLFSVPGNHDVDCESALPITWETIRKRNQEIFFCEDADGKRVRQFRASVFAAYLEFVKRHGIISPNPFEMVSLLHADPSLPVHIIATNTAFFSDFGEDSSKPTTPVPLASLRLRIKEGQSTKPLIILGHHSPSSFIQEHERQLRALLSDKKAVILHGHDHEPKASFNPDGTLRTLGFGATYVTSLGEVGGSQYVNSFAYCRLSDALQINAFSWQPSAGRWIDTTELHFADCITEGKYSGYAPARMPTLSQLAQPNRSAIISSIPRSRARPSKVIPIEGASEDVWKQFISLSDNVLSIFRKGDPTVRHLPQTDEKAYLELVSEDRRDLLVFITGVNHVLSTKEIESFNTTLDTKDYSSLTVISLGKITEDAYAMYLRLKTRKAIEVLLNKELTADADKILSQEQNLAIAKLDAGRHSVTVLVGQQETFLLVVDKGEREPRFHVIQKDGTQMLSSHALVSSLRTALPEFATMRYAGDAASANGEVRIAFNREAYLAACRKEYNVVKYAALANVGIRFADLPLEDLYVNASATEIDEAAHNQRLEALVEDHLATYPVSEAVKAHIQKQLLNVVRSGGQETSNAREFCQKYGAVLVTGDPGSGKTCFIKNEILAYCKKAAIKQGDSDEGPVSDWYSSHVPIMVQLSEVVAEQDFEKEGLFVIASRLLARRGFFFPAADMENMSKEGRVAWFFDGLDEVVSIEKRAQVVQQINVLVEKFLPIGNRIIVASRPAAVHVVNLLPSLHKLEIQGLTESEIRLLAARILRLKLSETSEGIVLDEGVLATKHSALIDQLVADCKSKPGVARLAQNPLLLTLLIMIYANAGAPSAKRHLIYEQAIQTLASVRGREAGHQPISAQDLRERLGAVALSVYRGESGLLPSTPEICEVVRAVMKRQRAEEVSASEARAFIQKVAESTGLIAIEKRRNGREDSVITFMHHSFLEYFAAIGLSRELEQFKVEDLVTQPRWREILTLLAGIIGENADVAPILSRFLDSKSTAEEVDARLLLFAIDCALECELPSEAAQRLIAKAIRKCLIEGPARLDPWIRSEIGQRLAQLLEASDGSEFDAVLADLMRGSDNTVSAASIELAGHMCARGHQSEKLLDAFNETCSRSEEAVLCAVCEAAGKSPIFRTKSSLDAIARCLKKGPKSKRAAFEVISKIPGLASNYWPEIITGIEDKDGRTSRSASLAALQAGLNADLISLSGNKKDTVVRALAYVDDFGVSDHWQAPQVKRETVERLLAAPYLRDRLLGIKLLPRTDADEKYIYDQLFAILNTSSDHQEIVAALVALRANDNVPALFTQGNLKYVAGWLDTGTVDVRIAAGRLLAMFGADMVAIDPLLSLNYRNLTLDEYRSHVQGISHAKVLIENVTKLLFGELEYLTDDNRKMSSDNVRRLKVVLEALKRIGRPGPKALVKRIKQMIRDYRIDLEVKQQALLCYPAIAVPSLQTVATITELVEHPPIGMDRELAQVPAILARQCRQSVEYVVACVGALIELRVALVKFHKRVARNEPIEETEFCVTELRSGIDAITDIIVAFHEFIENAAARSGSEAASTIEKAKSVSATAAV